jgi:hypothetical protein
MRLLFLFLLILAAGNAIAQGAHSPLSSLYTGIGTYSKHFKDAFSVTSNQATLADFEHSAAGIYGEQRFGVKELRTMSASLVFPVRYGGMGVHINHLGDNKFNNTQLGLAYGRKLGSRVNLGVQFNYHSMRIAGYGNISNITAEIGTIWQVSKKLQLGLHLNNLAGGIAGKRKTEKLPTVYKMGLGYEVSDQFYLSIETVKEENRPVMIKADMQYQFAGQFFTRMRVMTETGQFALGAGYAFKKCRLELISSFHPQLRFTPAILLLFRFNPHKEENKISE